MRWLILDSPLVGVHLQGKQKVLASSGDNGTNLIFKINVRSP